MIDALRTSLATEHLPDLPEKVTDRVFEMAWEQGHASGEHEVAQVYEDLADLIQHVIDNSKEEDA